MSSPRPEESGSGSAAPTGRAGRSRRRRGPGRTRAGRGAACGPARSCSTNVPPRGPRGATSGSASSCRPSKTGSLIQECWTNSYCRDRSPTRQTKCRPRSSRSGCSCAPRRSSRCRSVSSQGPLAARVAASSASRGFARRMWAPSGQRQPVRVRRRGSRSRRYASAGSSRSGASTSGAPLRHRPTILAASRSLRLLVLGAVRAPGALAQEPRGTCRRPGAAGAAPGSCRCSPRSACPLPPGSRGRIRPGRRWGRAAGVGRAGRTRWDSRARTRRWAASGRPVRRAGRPPAAGTGRRRTRTARGRPAGPCRQLGDQLQRRRRPRRAARPAARRGARRSRRRPAAARVPAACPGRPTPSAGGRPRRRHREGGCGARSSCPRRTGAANPRSTTASRSPRATSPDAVNATLSAVSASWPTPELTSPIRSRSTARVVLRRPGSCRRGTPRAAAARTRGRQALGRRATSRVGACRVTPGRATSAPPPPSARRSGRRAARSCRRRCAPSSAGYALNQTLGSWWLRR